MDELIDGAWERETKERAVLGSAVQVGVCTRKQSKAGLPPGRASKQCFVFLCFASERRGENRPASSRLYFEVGLLHAFTGGWMDVAKDERGLPTMHLIDVASHLL